MVSYKLLYLQLFYSSDQRKNTSNYFAGNLRVTFIWKINQNYNSNRVINKFAFILLLSFLTDQKQDSDFQQVGGLLTRNITDLCLERVLFYFKAMPNSADFYKWVFLHVIPIRIIVPW